MEKKPNRTRALDCGAGIGRITKHLLLKYFETVDLIDQNPDFIETAKAYVNSPQLGKLYCSGNFKILYLIHKYVYIFLIIKLLGY